MTDKPDAPEMIPYGQLLLDPTNPRLAGLRVSLQDQDEIIRWLWRNKAVNELVTSIAANGYWIHEELFATKEGNDLVVVEGNRRLAAVKLLMDPALGARLSLGGIPRELSEDVRRSMTELPVYVKPRRELWGYIGFKHVNGPQEWDSIAKAEYIFRVNQEFGVSPAEVAKTIGDEHETVMRLYRGYLVLKQAQDELDFDPDDSWNRRFPFSHLWTALGYTNARDFLGLTSENIEKPNPVPGHKTQELQELMLWLFGSRKDQIEPKVRRQNPDLRDLMEVLGSRKGLNVLRANLPLDSAYDAHLGDERLFQDALTKAEKDLRDAKGFVATGFRGDTDLLETAQNIAELSRSLHREMRTYTEESAS